MQKTANYNLNKPEYNNVADIVPAVDENMDIIDKTMGDLKDEIDNLGNKFKDINLDAANVSFTSSIADFAQKNVKLALDYLFQLANNGKKYWVDVVGWPLAITDTFAILKSKTQALKNTIAANIVNKGVSANGTDTLNSLADAISKITIEGMGGKRFKSGYTEVVALERFTNMSSSGSGVIPKSIEMAVVDITGFDFTPKFAILVDHSNNGVFEEFNPSIFPTIYNSVDGGGTVMTGVFENDMIHNVLTSHSYAFKTIENNNIIISNGRLRIPACSTWSGGGFNYYIFG